MNENPYRSPESSVYSTDDGTPAKNYGYWLVSAGYAFLGIYVFAAFQIVQYAHSTARFDRLFEHSVFLAPFLVLIPWLSLKALGKNNPTSIRYSSAALLFVFIVCSTLIFMIFSTV